MNISVHHVCPCTSSQNTQHIWEILKWLTKYKASIYINTPVAGFLAAPHFYSKASVQKRHTELKIYGYSSEQYP